MKHILKAVFFVGTFAPAALAVRRAEAAGSSVLTRATICGGKGYDSGRESFYDSDEGSYAGCSKACQTRSKSCKSFAFGNGECYLYDVNVDGNFEADKNSPYAFYDSCCMVSSTSTAASTKATSTSKAAATTTTTTTTIATKQVTTSKTTTSNSTPSTIKSTTRSTLSSSTTTTTTVKTTTTITSTTPNPTSTPTSSAKAPWTATTPPCEMPTWTISNFQWHNSSHNIECFRGGRDANNPNLCYPYGPTQDTGYGPPDTISMDISNFSSCYSQSPSFYPPQLEIGAGTGHIRCVIPPKNQLDQEQDNVHFFGSSNKPRSNAFFEIMTNVTCGGGDSSNNSGYTFVAYGNATAPMECSYDSSNNATCILRSSSSSVTVAPTRFYNVR